MCVIVMYKLSVSHAKIFYDFFASSAGFRQNSAEFFAKPAGNRLPKFQKNRLNYRQIRPIIRLIRPNFVFLKISSQLQFDRIFLIFPDFFQILQNGTDSPWHEFSFSAELCNTGLVTHEATV
jgi:hypothetical protein